MDYLIWWTIIPRRIFLTKGGGRSEESRIRKEITFSCRSPVLWRPREQTQPTWQGCSHGQSQTLRGLCGAWGLQRQSRRVSGDEEKGLWDGAVIEEPSGAFQAGSEGNLGDSDFLWWWQRRPHHVMAWGFSEARWVRPWDTALGTQVPGACG